MEIRKKQNEAPKGNYQLRNLWALNEDWIRPLHTKNIILTFVVVFFKLIAMGFLQKVQHCWNYNKTGRVFHTWPKERKSITVDYSGLHGPNSLAARFAYPYRISHKSEPEQKKQELKEKHRLDQPRLPIPSTPLGPFPYRWLFTIQHFTYLSHVFFHWLYNHGKILSSDFPMPWGRLLQTPNRRIWKKNH